MRATLSRVPEESTYGNPEWGTPPGAAERTTVGDLVTSVIAIGTGKLLSDASFHAMTDPDLLGFGSKQADCVPSCFTQIDAYNYGLGQLRSRGRPHRLVVHPEPAAERLQRRHGLPAGRADRDRRRGAVREVIRVREEHSTGSGPPVAGSPPL
jgi:hypothetical protein